MRLLATISLSDRQAAFVRHLLMDGVSGAEAAARAGYANPAHAAWQNLQLPSIRAAIASELARQLQNEIAPLAFGVIRKILKDDKGLIYGPRVVADVALKVAAMAGFVAPRQGKAQDEDDRDPGAMSTEELHALAAKLEAELAGRARVVEPIGTPEDQNLSDLL